MPVALPLLCSGRERRPRLAVMPLERLAPIPRCAECEAAWLPADEERWQAWLTDDEPPYPSSTARSALSGSAATEELGWTDLRRSRQGGPNHSRDPAPTQRSLAAAHGGPRPVAAARLGSGRNRRADPTSRRRRGRAWWRSRSSRGLRRGSRTARSGGGSPGRSSERWRIGRCGNREGEGQARQLPCKACKPLKAMAERATRRRGSEA
jgi:hypothetical protein